VYLFGITPSVYPLTSGANTSIEFTPTTTNANLGIIIRPTLTTGVYNYSVQEVSIESQAHYTAYATMKADYYPFGMQMPGRTLTTSNYRFGYNGMEKAPEMKGDGNSYTTEFRQYDPRLGRWASLDPLMMMFPHMSPYCAFDNNPIFYIDPYGLSATNNDGNGGPGNGKEIGAPEKKTNDNGELVDWVKGDTWLNTETGRGYMYDGENWGQYWTCPEVEVTGKASGWTRFWGGVKAVGGFFEAAAGAILITSGVGAPLGVVLLVHGCDVMAAGVTQAYTGEETQTFTYQGIHKVATSAGASDETADMIAGGTEIVLSGAAGGSVTKVPGTLSTSTTVVTSESIVVKTEEIVESYVSPSADELLDIVVSQSKKPWRVFGGIAIRGTGGMSGNKAIFDIVHVEGNNIFKVMSGFSAEAAAKGATSVTLRTHAVINKLEDQMN
jgi:RHS repeat-associated protein